MARDVNDCRSPPMSIKQRMVHRVVAQFHQPRGLGGRLAGWTMASRASNRIRNVWVVSLLDIAPLRTMLRSDGRIAIASQPRCPGATAETSAEAGHDIARRLLHAGFVAVEMETLPLDPPVVCVLATAPG